MDTYTVYRFFQDDTLEKEVIDEGLTLEEAQTHCSGPDSKGDGWFDGYEKE